MQQKKVTFDILDKEIEITEYAPDIFAHLRMIEGIKMEHLRESLDPQDDKNIANIFKAGEGMGKSGSFFFFSHDSKFLIKTMTTDDFDAFMKLFVNYFEHICLNENSLIARIYGVYRIVMENQNPVYLICMGNTK